MASLAITGRKENWARAPKPGPRIAPRLPSPTPPSRQAWIEKLTVLDGGQLQNLPNCDPESMPYPDARTLLVAEAVVGEAGFEPATPWPPANWFDPPNLIRS